MSKATAIRGLSARASLREAGPRLLAARLRDVSKLESALPAAEAVHDMRIALRRLRAALRLLRRRELDGPVKELQDALGQVRDLQLQIGWLRERDKQLASRREKLLASKRARLDRALEKWRAQTLPSLLSPAKSSGKLGGGRTRKMLRKRLRRFQERLDAAVSRPQPAILHRVRISVKQLRYLLELTEKALPPARRLLPELLPLQKALGELHDVDLRIQLLRSHRLAALLREQKETRTQLLKVVAAELSRWKTASLAPHARKTLR